MNNSINNLKFANEIYLELEKINSKELHLQSIANLLIQQDDENTIKNIILDVSKKQTETKETRRPFRFSLGNDGELDISTINADSPNEFFGALMSGFSNKRERKPKQNLSAIDVSNGLMLKIIALIQNDLNEQKIVLGRKIENRLKKELKVK